MTNQILLSSNEFLDLESLDFRQAKARVKDLYRSIRSEKIRTFYCELLRPYFLSLHRYRLKREIFAGVSLFNKHELELTRVFGDKLDIKGVFILVIGKDVTPELALDTIQSISMAGLIVAPHPVLAALHDRIHSGIWL